MTETSEQLIKDLSTLSLRCTSAESFLLLEGDEQFSTAHAAALIESLTSENTRLRALLEEKEQRLKDTEFLYRGYYVLATESGCRPGSRELMEASKRFDEVLGAAVKKVREDLSPAHKGED